MSQKEKAASSRRIRCVHVYTPLSPSCLLRHHCPCRQSESSTSSSDKSGGYHSSAAIYRAHLLWVTSIFQTLLKLALKSYFQQAFHLVQLCQHDLRTMSCDFGELASAPRIKTQSSSRFSCFCVSEWLPPRSHGGKKSLRHTNQQTSGPMNYNKILEIIYTDKNLCHHVLLKIRQLLSMFLLLF